MVNSILPQVQKIELEIVAEFNNQNKSGTDRHYAENFKEHDEIWLNKIQHNMSLSALNNEYKKENRAIAINNTFARAVGQGLFLPLLKYFPENPDINSQANKPTFKLVYLDALNDKALSPQAFTKYFIKPAMPMGM